MYIFKVKKKYEKILLYVNFNSKYQHSERTKRFRNMDHHIYNCLYIWLSVRFRLSTRTTHPRTVWSVVSYSLGLQNPVASWPLWPKHDNSWSACSVTFDLWVWSSAGPAGVVSVPVHEEPGYRLSRGLHLPNSLRSLLCR